MGDLTQDIAASAEDAVVAGEFVCGEQLDYSEASLAAVQKTLAEAAGWDAELTPEQFKNFAQSFGCYVLEVARRALGGRYHWFDSREAPVLVVGEPDFRIALLTWDQVRGRLTGDLGCDTDLH